MVKKLSITFMMLIVLSLSSTFNMNTSNVREIDKIVAGDYHTVVLTSNGRVFTWGQGLYGQLGNGTNGIDAWVSTPTEITQNFNLQSDDTIVEIAGGETYTFAISSSGKIFAWGYNLYGELGDGTTLHKNLPVEITQNFNLSNDEKIVMIEARYRNIAVSSNGRIFAWGYNGSLNDTGLLGDGTSIDRHTPVEITQNFNLQEEEKIDDIVIDKTSTFVLTSVGRILAWGNNIDGTLGDGTRINRPRPVDITENIITSPNCIYPSKYVNNPFDCVDELLPLDLQDEETIKEISKWYLITSTGRVFGRNYSYSDGKVNHFLNENTQNFNLQSEETIKEIIKKYHHTLAITSKSRIFTWGSNKKGQLGDGSTNNSLIFPIEITQNLNLYSKETIVEISSGIYHNIVITSTGRVFVWGDNRYGQLGDGTTTARLLPIEITIKL